MDTRRRVLLVCYPSQGHINPTLQFAKRLLRLGLSVTFLTSSTALNRMSRPLPPVQGLDLVGFATEYESGVRQGVDFNHLLSQIRLEGSREIRDLLSTAADEGRPFSRVIYAILTPWAAVTAREFHVPSTLLWIQPASILDVYYYYFNGYEEEIKSISNGSTSRWVQLPGLPELGKDDLPSFVVNDAFNFLFEIIEEHLQVLESEEDSPAKILINTCETLEPEALKAITKFNMIPIGPMIPTGFLDGHDEYPSDKSFGGDMFTENSRDYINWLDSKPNGSVIYVSFGSYLPLPPPQIKEIASGLITSRKPFLWVIRDNQKDESWLSNDDELETFGKTVTWCSQIEVLSHPSLGCFVTHCGWNSTLESLACGVPMVGFPHWSDQTTNAKLIADVWRVGVRVEKEDDGIVKGEELKKCVEMVMKEENEMKKNAGEWRLKIQEAGKHGGQSDLNVQNFLVD